MPCCNCCVLVPRDRFVVTKRSGRLGSVLPPGLNFGGLDCCGLCISYSSVSARLNQRDVQVDTSTKDNFPIMVIRAIQWQVDPVAVHRAMLQKDIEGKID